MSEKISGGTEHKLTKKGMATFYEVYEPSEDGLEKVDSENRGPCEMNKSYNCSCGRKFYKEEIAAEHLRSVSSDSEHTGGSDE